MVSQVAIGFSYCVSMVEAGEPSGCAVRTTCPTTLDGDANHDGVIDDDDDPLKDTLPGVIVLCNVDDDDQNGTPDKDDPGVVPGEYDLAEVIVRAIPDLPDGWNVTLALRSASNVAPGIGDDGVVRVFSTDNISAQMVAGPGRGPIILRPMPFPA
jgi:hypothetical protein